MAQRMQRIRIMLDSVRFQSLHWVPSMPPCASFVGIVFSVFALDQVVVFISSILPGVDPNVEPDVTSDCMCDDVIESCDADVVSLVEYKSPVVILSSCSDCVVISNTVVGFCVVISKVLG